MEPKATQKHSALLSEALPRRCVVATDLNP